MAQPLPQTVLFDLDGTLVDNFEAIHRCYDDVMSMMGLPGVTLEQVRRASACIEPRTKWVNYGCGLRQGCALVP